jgi:peptide/nickel transport system permease protein
MRQCEAGCLMLRMILSRFLYSAVTIIGVGLVLFLLTRSIGDSPAHVVLGIEATQDAILGFEKQHGLDRPVLVQYFDWISSILTRGDFGRSFVTGRQASDEIRRGLPVTLQLVVLAFFIALSAALPLGILAATHRGTWVDQVARILAVVGLSIPGFWLGLLLIRFISLELNLLPPGGYTPPSVGIGANLQTLILPAIALALYQIAMISRMMRSSLLDVLSQDYIRTATAMGLRRRKVLFYAVRNALGPVIPVAALSFGYTFGWALIIEQVFSIPGMSRSLLTAITQRDFILVQSIVFVFTLIFILCNLSADILNAALNPRLRGRAQ